ncbi:ABC transporter permease [Williamsia sterculiae]|uniref:ABC-2 type transport system permease protein n=1 Tax=Williamsia sterculiae TaxID=1344003 RepID=A0A1N7DF06_9NOCA|nr:ABC transporter permease [Williamsia sterculiae]SIR74392.1 ABC-2 type transport system permease protein [Williamsia sterculiae]
MSSSVSPHVSPSGSAHDGPSLGAARAVGLVARREISTRARTRSFLIVTGLLLVVIVGGIIIWSAVSGGDKATKIGVVGGGPTLSQTLTDTAKATGTDIQLVPIADANTARDKVSGDDVKTALIDQGNGRFQALSDKDLEPEIQGVLQSAVSSYGLQQSLAARGVDLSSVTGTTTLTTEQLKADKPNEGQRIAVALVGMSLLMFAVIQGGSMVAAGVVEEKSSRVVELLLAAVRPLHLLWGKILGIGTIAFAQVVVLGAAALITATATGLISIAGTAVSMFLATLVWFLLGFLFFATLYAATGAMASRTEELNSTSAPLTILAMAVLYAGYFGISSLDSTFMQVISWIPPFSASLMPIRIATGDTNAVQVIATIAIMIVTCVAAIWLAARIYQRSILRTGSKMSWKDAVRLNRA